jgi:hypothetical protein
MGEQEYVDKEFGCGGVDMLLIPFYY